MKNSANGHFSCLITVLLLVLPAYAFEYENSSDYPLMGDWIGKWINPHAGHEKAHPHMAAQLIPVRNGNYRVVILPELYNRAVPYLNVEVPGSNERIVINQGSFDVVFEGNDVRGKANLHGKLTEFVLKKQEFSPPTVGMKPPEGATVLFDGSSYNSWKHENGKPVTWNIVDDAMQVVTIHDKNNREKGLGGSIETKEKYSSMKFHMEFRYPVEAKRSGQRRGNSGLFFLPIGEVQILNSYTTDGYWNEAGSIYKRVPAKVNAAGPPLAWQTYDVELELPKNGGDKAVLTVLLNGKTVHNKMELNSGATEVSIMLQDHINPIQFRNIWLVETTTK